MNLARLRGCITGLALISVAARAQYRQEPGHSIGTATKMGKLIVLTLEPDALGKANLFDLQHHTLHFTPEGSGYRVKFEKEQWNPDFGAEMQGSEARLKSFAFPFSGKTWNEFSVGLTGSITFGPRLAAAPRPPSVVDARDTGGLSVDRFAELQQAGPQFVNQGAAIAAFFKPRLSGKRYLKEDGDRTVITWSLTEPVGGIQDMTWTPTVNRFQAVLHKDGAIDLNYDEIHAEDAIVGVYPMVTQGGETQIGVIEAGENPQVPSHLDIKSVRVTAVDGLFLKVTLEMRGAVLAENDPGLQGVAYRVCIDRARRADGCTGKNDVVWTVQAGGGRGRGGFGSGAPRYGAFGNGVQSAVKAAGNTISLEGTLPEGYKSGDTAFFSAAVQRTDMAAAGGGGAAANGPRTERSAGLPATVDMVTARAIRLAGIASPAVHFTTTKPGDGPFPTVYEVFHYMRPPRAQDLTCSVIQALGDKFDMLAYYSDFRIDNPEAGTSSTGPLGGGPNGGQVTGIGANQRNLAGFCTQGRFQWQFIQPVYAGANQMQEFPPDGLIDTNTHNIVTYSHQLAERSANGKIPPYDYAMSQIGHEMGHRWSAFVSAKVGNETIELGPTHWARGLQAPASFPYQRPTEASAMGGGVWQDNFDGTFTQLDDDYYVPATGYSYLDLYLMGLISPAEVPDFFILRNLQPQGNDANGHPIFKAERTKITVQDVIAVEGPREPDVDHSQKNFNTGMVLVVEHGKVPSQKLIDAVNRISDRWIDYWTTVTGHRATMTVNPD